MNDDRFVGVWEMDVDQNQYEFGDAPIQGTYIIESSEGRYIMTMKWTTPAGQERQMTYEAIPDGERHEYIDTAGVTELSMTRIDENTLDSEAFNDGLSIAFARRTLSEDGNVMTVMQHGKTSDGQAFANKSVYYRKS